MRESRTFSMTSLSVPLARQFVAHCVAGLPDEVCQTAILLVSELATNSLIHASSEFEVTVIYPAPSGGVRVEVSDGDRSRPQPLYPPPTATHGRGLQMVDTLAGSWGVNPVGDGKTVWFELVVPASLTATTSEETQPEVHTLGNARDTSPLIRVRLPRRRFPGLSLPRLSFPTLSFPTLTWVNAASHLG
jgi:anti-sigma regulatory factor (Ser/Thr protein kinase)